MGSPSSGVGGSASSATTSGASASGGGTSSGESSSGSPSSGGGGADFGSSVSQAANDDSSSGGNRGQNSASDDDSGRTTSSSSSPSSPDSGLTPAQSAALANSAGVIDGYALTSEDEPAEDENAANPAVIGRSAARARDNYVGAQTQQVRDAVRDAPITSYEGDVYRNVDTPNTSTYNDGTFSRPGRYSQLGEPTLYTSETMRGIELEASRYPGETDPSGLAGKTVVRSDFSGTIIDATDLPNVTQGALTEGYGYQGQERSALSHLMGEDPYTHPRAVNDQARARGVDAVRVPAGDGLAHVNIMPGNLGDPAAQLQYRDHVDFDANGRPGAAQSTPADIQSPPPASAPSNYDPSSPRYDADWTAKVAGDDLRDHSRAGGVRYGAAGGGIISGMQALSDGELTVADARDVAVGTGAGAAAAYADDALAPRIGGVRAGGVVDGVISAGTSVYGNAQAYERGEISAADATADVVVDTGVGVASGLAGAAAGAAIGSVVPVAGTAVGAAIGFGVGMLASWGASTALEESGAADWAREGLGDTLEDNVSDGVLEGAWDTISGWFGG